MPAHRDDVLKHLQGIRLPDGRTALVGSPMLSEIVIRGDRAIFSIAIDPADVEIWEPIRRAAQAAAAATPGLAGALVTLTAEASPDRASPPQPR